jgi:lipopolysaccharide transport system permease protein
MSSAVTGGCGHPQETDDSPKRRKKNPVIDPRIIDLVLYKTYADLRAEAEKTYINYLWWVIDPVLTMLVFYVVFGLIFERGGEGFVPFMLTGLVMWMWYKQSISHASNAIMTGKGLMNQVHVPKLVFPTVTLLTDLTKFGFVFALLLVFLWVSGFGVGIAYVGLPVVLIVQFLLCTALAYLLAALVPYLPDFKLLVEHFLNLQFFLTGIFFAADRIPERYQFWFYLNPMASLIQDYRNVLLHNAWPHWGRLSVIAAAALVVLVLAVNLIRRLDQDYPRVVR